VKALTIRQPWAAAIVHGDKRTENRPRPIPVKHLGTTILIHAAKAVWNGEAAEYLLKQRNHPDVRSAVIGTARLVSCHFSEGDDCCADWGMPDWFHWQLEDIRALAEPVPASGQLGLWTPPVDVLAAVQTQLEQQEALR
jgi:hypothetical protein